MRAREIKELVESTSDPSFAADGEGLIVAWNAPAAELFGVPADEAIGKPCGHIVQGVDECGPVCSRDCTIHQAVRKQHPIGNFDLQVHTPQGMRWCNVSVLTAPDEGSSSPYAIHIIKQIDVRKRLEMAMRDFIVQGTGLPVEEASAIISSSRAAASGTELTAREVGVLRLLAKGATTTAIAAQLRISRTTVNNHIQHILRKLDVHTRLEAIRRAEHAGLI